MSYSEWVIIIGILVGGVVWIMTIIQNGRLRKENRELKAENATLKAQVAEFETQVGPEFRKKMKATIRQENCAKQVYNSLVGSLFGLDVAKPALMKDDSLTGNIIHVITITDSKKMEIVMRIKLAAWSWEGIRLDTLYCGEGTGYGIGRVDTESGAHIIEYTKTRAKEYYQHYSFNSNPHGA